MPSSPFSFHYPDADHVGAFGRRLKALRRQAGLTRKELAARAGMSPHHLNKVERGASGPSFGAIHALAAGLGVDPVAFFADTDNPGLSVAGSEPPASISPTPWPELVPRIALLGLGQQGRVILSPSLSALLGLDGLRQVLSLDGFLERHVDPADRIALKLDLENLAAGVPVQVREVRLLPASGARIVVVLQNADWFLEQTVSGDEGQTEGPPKDQAVWMTVVDVTHLDAVLRDHSANQVGQIFQLEELIRERERCSQAMEQENHARRQAERMMLDAQRLLQGVMHSSQDALIILHPDLSVLDGNSEMHRLCNGKCDPAYDCRMQHLMDGKALRRIKELAAQALSSGFLVHGDVRIRDKDLELRLFPVLDATDKPQRLVLWMRDASQTSQQRVELRKQRLLLEKAEQMARMGSWEWDMEADVFRMSPNWFAIHGCRPRVLTAPELFPLAHPEDLPAIQDSLQKVLDGEPEYRIEHRIIRQDTGDVRWVSSLGEVVRDETGRSVKLFGVCQDVTEIRQGMQVVLS
ncbi:PAS domain S-box-containing protein [Desulfonatronum zhilinae]|nr:PAS domain S-box-containing protein [Desulfonatronum zhilinae]